MVEVDLENFRERVWRHIEEDSHKLETLMGDFKLTIKEGDYSKSSEILSQTLDPIIQIVSRCRFLTIIDIMKKEAKRKF